MPYDPRRVPYWSSVSERHSVEDVEDIATLTIRIQTVGACE